MFAAARLERPITGLYRPVVPFILLMLLALLMVTYAPGLTAFSLSLGPH
jgi:TRAP-type C4-dicarboxylate transport system permease large subunit